MSFSPSPVTSATIGGLDAEAEDRSTTVQTSGPSSSRWARMSTPSFIETHATSTEFVVVMSQARTVDASRARLAHPTPASNKRRSDVSIDRNTAPSVDIGASGATDAGSVVVVVVWIGASVDVVVSTGAVDSTVSGAVVSAGAVVSTGVAIGSVGDVASSWLVRIKNAPIAAITNGTTNNAARATGDRRLLTIVRLPEVRDDSWPPL